MFSFLYPADICLFVEMAKKKTRKKDICTANLEHLDVFYSQRCYIPGIYNLNK